MRLSKKTTSNYQKASISVAGDTRFFYAIFLIIRTKRLEIYNNV